MTMPEVLCGIQTMSGNGTALIFLTGRKYFARNGTAEELTRISLFDAQKQIQKKAGAGKLRPKQRKKQSSW